MLVFIHSYDMIVKRVLNCSLCGQVPQVACRESAAHIQTDQTDLNLFLDLKSNNRVSHSVDDVVESSRRSE